MKFYSIFECNSLNSSLHEVPEFSKKIKYQTNYQYKNLLGITRMNLVTAGYFVSDVYRI